jgi:cholesterol transport system auxiliary component
MKRLLIGLLLFSTLFFMPGCSISPKQPALHDFGLPVSTPTDKTPPTVTVDAPTWLWDNRIRYRQLYASSTRVGFYALDLWIAPPPELFEQLLIAYGNTRNYSLVIRLQDFEQQFDAPDRARVVLRFSVDAYSDNNHQKVGTQAFYLERPAATPDAAGAVNGFATLTRQATDKIQSWLAGLPGK